jgi:cytochrome P450
MYHFVSRWWVEGTVFEVTEVFRDGGDLARWWPATYLSSTVVEPGDETGLGLTVDLESKGLLPYRLHWRARAVKVNHPFGYTLEATGDFVGRGVWTFRPAGAWVDITYDWRIHVDKPLLRHGAFLFRRLYGFNHRWAMKQGERSLRLELARRRALTAAERAAVPPPPPPVGLAPRHRGRVGKTAPYLRGARLVGVLPELVKDPPAFLMAAAREHGPVVGMRVGPYRTYSISHPDGVARVVAENMVNYEKDPFSKIFGLAVGLDNVFVADNGAGWYQDRRRIAPALAGPRVAALGEQVMGIAGEVLRKWEALAAGGTPFDLAESLKRDLMAPLATSVLLGPDARPETERIERAMETATAWFSTYMGQVVRVPLSVPTPANRRMQQAVDTLQSATEHFMRAREADGPSAPPTVASLLQDARPVGGAGAALEARKVRDMLIASMLITSRQVANGLVWVLVQLAEAPEVAARLHDELDRVLGGRPVTAADLADLPYTGLTLREAMRRHSVTWAIARVALQDDVVMGYRIPAGAQVFINFHGIHHDPEFWPEPGRFDPERHLPERSEGRHPFAYLPFSAGPRDCLGQDYALMVMQLFMATVLQRVHIHVLPDPPIEHAAVGGLVVPRHGVRVRLEALSGPAQARAI